MALPGSKTAIRGLEFCFCSMPKVDSAFFSPRGVSLHFLCVCATVQGIERLCCMMAARCVAAWPRGRRPSARLFCLWVVWPARVGRASSALFVFVGGASVFVRGGLCACYACRPYVCVGCRVAPSRRARSWSRAYIIIIVSLRSRLGYSLAWATSTGLGETPASRDLGGARSARPDPP